MPNVNNISVVLIFFIYTLGKLREKLISENHRNFLARCSSGKRAAEPAGIALLTAKTPTLIADEIYGLSYTDLTRLCSASSNRLSK